MPGSLHYGDNLAILRSSIQDHSVDLVYLDPPFNSKRAYHQVFKGTAAEEPIFHDYWQWDEVAAAAYRDVCTSRTRLAGLMPALARVLERDTMAYLSMMAPRLLELHRVLKPTGSLYLHCDPTAGHYLKVLLDAIFGAGAFRNEITWKRAAAHSDGKQGRRAFGNVGDTLLYYTKSDEYAFNPQYTPYDREYVEKTYCYVDSDGRRWKSSDLTGPGGAAKGNPYFEFLGVKRYWRYTRENLVRLRAEGRIHQSRPGAVPRMKHYLDEMCGVPLQNIWDDIRPVSSHAVERLGFPTQKPLALLERIVAISSHPGEVVLDPFCGCGTTIVAAERLGRRWVGIDAAPRAIALVLDRLGKLGVAPTISGWPTELGQARQLAKEAPVAYARWAVFRLGGRWVEGGGLVQGEIENADAHQKPRALIAVRGGRVGAEDVRRLGRAIVESQARAGILLSLEEPGERVRENARRERQLQLMTVAELLSGSRGVLPSRASSSGRRTGAYQTL